MDKEKLEPEIKQKIEEQTNDNPLIVENELKNIIYLIKSIIKFSDENKLLAIYIKSTFWIYLLKQYNISDWENINNCFNLRIIYKEYNKLINILIQEETKTIEYKKRKKDDIYQIIKSDINGYYDRDEFAFILNKNIKELFESKKKKKLSNSEILGTVEKFNPFFNIKDPDDNEKYKNSRETYIFDYINYSETTEAFNQTFKQLNFEKIFKENITEFINKITSKIKDITTFGNIIKLIDITRIQDKKRDYYNILKDKYDSIIKNEIQSLKEDKLDKAVKIVSEFISKIFLDDDDTSFLEEKISKLDDKIKSLIYNELIKTNKGKEYEKMKYYIYDIFLKKIEDIDNIKQLIKNLSEDDKKIFLDEKLMKTCEFTKDEFFSNKENKKIKLLCSLKEDDELNILEKNNKYARKLEKTLDEIRKDLEGGLIMKNVLEKFLNKEKSKEEETKDKKKEKDEKKNEDSKSKVKNKADDRKKEIIIQKLGLIQLIIEEYDPVKKYGEYESTINKINENVEKLNFIKDSLVIFHKNKYREVINKIMNIINDIEKKPVIEFNNDKMKSDLQDLFKYNYLCDQIKKVKGFLLFKKIFENAQGKDQSERFEYGQEKLKNLLKSFEENSSNIEIIFNEKDFVNIFKNIKEELGKKDESKSDEFIQQMLDYFNIKEDKKKEELTIIIKSKKYEIVVKSIKYFFDNFLDKKLILPKNIELSQMNLKDLRKALETLRGDGIYDYQSPSPFYKVFTSLYEKKEAIDFLISKLDIDIIEFSKNLKDKLDPTNRSISIKDIDNTVDCLIHFKYFKNLDAKGIINYIKDLDDEIKNFESYSKKYGSIIELDRKNEKDVFEKVYLIIKDASLIFNLDNEDFCYKIDNNNIPIKIEELIKLKNKINIQPHNKKNIVKTDGKDEDFEDPYEMKCDKLIFYKNIISNVEIIYDKINILRTKGFNIPIVITITITYPNVTYKLNNLEKKFSDIKDYLFIIKNDYENQLNTIYSNEKYLRLLYGKLFRKIKLHQEGLCDLFEINRYILNKTDNKEEIKDGQIYNEEIGDDYEVQYNEYTKKIFDNISRYVISLFKNNQLDFSKHYEKILIKQENSIKGIDIQKCDKEGISMEEYILNLFKEKLGQLPIAQNILICSKETSIEEMQSFLYRAILCEFNTLFIVEILESFSNFQHNKMYSYIDKLLSYKFENAKKLNKDNKNIDKSRSREYLNSFIVFVYKKLDNELAFKNELGKYTQKKEKKKDLTKNNFNKELSNLGNEKENKLNNDLNISNISQQSFGSIQDDDISKNIKVFTSDVCGLGKSFKIKKMIIKELRKRYYHFPLGGMLTKNAIFQKVSNLFTKIKEDAKYIREKNKKKSNITNDDEDKDINEEEYLEFNNVAIHLDLIESEETSLINEFLFSFLITKFYTNNEDIIYIPNNLKIFIEIPNSFDDYLKKYGILNAFQIENIILGKLKENNKNELKRNNITNKEMLELELEENVKSIFEQMIGKKTNKEIQDFIQENIGLKEYSYHQVQTFIKLFISQFSIFKGKLKFLNSQEKNITDECINLFAKSTMYFTNGGFARLIMDKKHKIKNKIDLCLDAYENDLNKINFKTPLVFIDQKTKKCKYEILPDISEEEKTKDINKNISKIVDIAYLIDATGSMNKEINAAKDYCNQIFIELKDKYKDYDFHFGAVFYRDKIDSKNDENECFDLTNDMEDLKKNISNIKGYGGGDGPEDWVGGYTLALNNMTWRNGIKLIIHIADAGAHGKEFSNGDKHEDQGPLLGPLIQECAKNKINIIGFKISNYPKKSFEKISEIYNDYKLMNKDSGQFIEIYDFVRGDSKAVSENFHKLVLEAVNEVVNPSYKFLKRLKEILYLPNDLEKDIGDKKSLLSILDLDTDNYVITEDNYKKMVLLVYRIKANVPVIIMGETGCGKTSLIVKLSQILNNGIKSVEIIDIHPGITDEVISKNMEKINTKAKSKDYILDVKNNKRKELWVFFDEINTCLSFSLLTEIFICRTFNGVKLEDNIRLIGACNPYRKRKPLIERCGLTREDDKDDEFVYKVEQMPQSLLYYVFSFGSLKDEDEKKYIKSIIQKLFNKEEEKLSQLTTKAISKCHIFLRDNFNKDPSVVSLREIARFKKCIEFFQDYFRKKNEIKYPIDDDTKKLYKIKSIICSIYLCYYIRLTNDKKRGSFDTELQKTLLDIVNVYWEEKIEEKKASSLLEKIKNKKLKDDLRGTKFQKFSDLLQIEEEFLLEQIDLDKGIGKNQLLKENLFLLFLAVIIKIPLIIVGKPGTGKSLSAQLLCNSMKGKYSKNNKIQFFKKYPQIIQIYFQGSESTNPEDVIELFKKAEGLCENNKENNKKNDKLAPIYMILFDELGLAEKSPTKPLKVLHSKLEYDGKSEGVCFIGISNYSLDAAKINRALSLSVPNLEDKLEQLKSTSKSIVESISEDLPKDTLIFDILSRAYYLYKFYLNFIKKLMVLKQYIEEKKKKKGQNFKEIEGELDFIKLLKKEKKIKSEFHGNRDFYNIIKGVAIEGAKLNDITNNNLIVPIINNYIERNFGGIRYEIDINFDLEYEDINTEMKKLKEKILNEKLSAISVKKKKDDDDEPKEKEDNSIKVSSVFLFKKIYNEACDLEENKAYKIKGDIYKIKKDYLEKYDLNKCINDNINDNNSRHLLLEIKSNLAPLINQNIRIQNPDRKDIGFINGSPFSDDNNNEYKVKKVGEIQNCASIKDKVIILQNLDPIQPYLYDLYNMNYKIIDEQKFVRICLENFSEQLTPVNDSFRIIILVDKKFVDSVDMAFLNRLEKMQISFKDLLDNEHKNIIKEISDEIRLKEEIKTEQSKMNYDLNILLINCGNQEIGGLVYNSFLQTKKEKIVKDIIKDNIYSKISNLLPQDIITILPETNVIKKKYYEKKRYYNFKQYIKDLKSGFNDINKYKISIIYTFSNIANIIEGYNNGDEFMISEINKEEKLKSYIDDIKSKNSKENIHIILIRFEQYNSNKIQFIIDFINNYYNNDDYNYIFIIYLKRSFQYENRQKKERIYSIPNIYNDINQLFIDNLEGPEISLKSLLGRKIKDILLHADVFNNLDEEFKDSLINFVNKEMTERSKADLINNSKISDFSTYLSDKYNEKSNLGNVEKYSDEIVYYMTKKDIDFKNELIKKAKELIDDDKDAQGDCYSLVNKMFKSNYINKDKIDIISCILDYIKENIFKKYLKDIFRVLESNNFLTTLLELDKDKYCKLDKNDKNIKPNNKNIIKQLKNIFLKELKIDNDKKDEPKFLFNYKIPGFYNFYKNLSDYLNNDVTTEFSNNEKKLRFYFDNNPNIVTDEFHEKEKELLNQVLEKISKDKLYYDLINKITPDLILEDYITYYLEKYLGIYSNSYYKTIDLLLRLRFSEEKEIIKYNEDYPINIILIKIMWIESNINYIESILKAFEHGKDIANDREGLSFYQSIYDFINNKEFPIEYIVNENRNPEHTREVNECFYKLLAGLCLSVTSNDIDINGTIGDYFEKLKDINKIIQSLNDDLIIYLNELYVVDELIKISEYLSIKNPQKINIIREYLTENAKIIQKNDLDKTTKLIKNFQDLNNLLIKEKDEQFKSKYNDTLKYIYFKEIKKINNTTYRSSILAELIKEKEIIKVSNDIFQILFRKYISIDEFKLTKVNLFHNENNALKLIDKNLSNDKNDYYLALSETLLYFFEKNSIIYLKGFSKIESFEKDPLEIFKECIDFLYKLKKKSIKTHGKLTYITKIFCLGYIKSFCYLFIKMHDKPKFKPDNIVSEINKIDTINMVKLYIYKIIFNKNNKQIAVFFNNTIKDKYQLEKYDNFKDFIKPENEEKFDYGNMKSGNENYRNVYQKLEEFRKDEFENEIRKKDISSNGKLNFDDFYMAAYNLILSNLKKKEFENNKIYINFYENVCVPLYKKNEEEENKLIILMQFLFDKEKYSEIKKEYKIDSEDIEVLLYGYRYCLNEIKEEYEDEDYIYSSLYDLNQLNNLDEKFYPGSDMKQNSYYELYNKIKNHFKNKPLEGCYVCLCSEGYYHPISNGFPGYSEIDLQCPKCKNKIGAKEKYKEEIDEKENKVMNYKIYEAIKSENPNYYRIFKDEEEIEKLDGDRNKYSKLKEINYITLKQFIKRKIKPLYDSEKGLNKIDKNSFIKDNKTIRNLSQLSYRLLNYILYCHLFFAKLYTNADKFDNYLPEGMTWFDTIKECFILLKKELEKKDITQIEIFMNGIFKDLFNKLHDKKNINNYEKLIEFENELEKLIQKNYEKTKFEIDNFKEFERKSINDEKSAIAILKEIYNKDKYDKKEYPYYEFFYYTDYLDEEYVDKILKYKDENEYPVLIYYLENKKQKKSKDKYSLDNFIIFNKVIKIFNDKYSGLITRELSEKIIIENSDIYQDNERDKLLIDKFIIFYNGLDIEDKITKKKLELDPLKNCINDFLLIEDNKYGKSYKEIYKIFIEKQNNELEKLLDKKINSGDFNSNCKNRINVQQIKEDEIFSLPKKFDFTDVLFNSSYRKIIDTQSYENYNEYIINLKQLEIEMTELLLKNKKLLNDGLIYFHFNNEVFSNEISDLLSNFKYVKMNMNIDDKVLFYKFVMENDGNDEKYKVIINNFITLIEYLNKMYKENDNTQGNTKIFEIDIVKNQKNISKDFKDIFENKNDLTISKITNIFDYYLKLIFKYIKKDIEKYQEKKIFDEDLKKKLEDIFKPDMVIKKGALQSAIRLFISLVLYTEKDKDKGPKIKSNKKNIVEYLKGKDLWETNIYKSSKFDNNLLEIKKLNIKVKEILYFYYYLINNEDEGFAEEVEGHIKDKGNEEEGGEEVEEEEKEEEDEEEIRNRLKNIRD